MRFQGRLFVTKVRELRRALPRPGDEGLTPKLLSASARIVEREVRGFIPVRDDGNLAGYVGTAADVEGETGSPPKKEARSFPLQPRRPTLAVRIPSPFCFIVP